MQNRRARVRSAFAPALRWPGRLEANLAGGGGDQLADGLVVWRAQWRAGGGASRRWLGRDVRVYNRVMTRDDQQAAAAFLCLLRRATKYIGDRWFRLPYAGDFPAPPQSRSRERVYCYELYHQIRRLTEEESDKQAAPTYALSAEIDKSGLNKEGGKHKPDFVWHVPGTQRNAVVMEVKSTAALPRSGYIENDLRKLMAFIDARGRGYACGVLLVFGSGTSEVSLRERVLGAADRVDLAVPTRSRVNLMWHRAAGEPAEDVGTLEALSRSR